MPKADPIEFDALPSLHYFKSNAQAAPFVRQIDAFPDALGMDSASGGFLVLHRRHSMSGLEEEMPVALILKKLGHRVLLLEEVRHGFVLMCRSMV